MLGREHLFSKNESIREAAARVLGNTLNTVGDADDASNIMREVVLNMGNDEGSTSSAASTVWGGGGGRRGRGQKSALAVETTQVRKQRCKGNCISDRMPERVHDVGEIALHSSGSG